LLILQELGKVEQFVKLLLELGSDFLDLGVDLLFDAFVVHVQLLEGDALLLDLLLGQQVLVAVILQLLRLLLHDAFELQLLLLELVDPGAEKI